MNTADAAHSGDEAIVSEVPDHLFDKFGSVPNFSTGTSAILERFEARRRRELDELNRYGHLRPTLPDNSDDPRVLARDIALYNLGDTRVAQHGRWEAIRDFATKIGVALDENQTGSSQIRVR